MFLNLFYLVLFSALIYVFGTALVSRWSVARRVNVYFRIALLGFATLPLIWFCRGQLSNEFFNFILFDSILHLALGALFAQFICLPDRALTLRLLVELYESGEKGLSLSELNARFSLEKMIRSRLQQMHNGQVLEIASDGQIVLREKGLSIGNLILKGRKFFNITSAN